MIYVRTGRRHTYVRACVRTYVQYRHEAEIDAGKKQQMELEQEDAEFREKNEAAYEERDIRITYMVISAIIIITTIIAIVTIIMMMTMIIIIDNDNDNDMILLLIIILIIETGDTGAGRRHAIADRPWKRGHQNPNVARSCLGPRLCKHRLTIRGLSRPGRTSRS